MEKFKVLGIVKNIFESYGYRVVSGEEYLTAEKEGDKVAVGFEPKLNREAIDSFAGVVSHRGLLISERVSPELRSFALNKNIVIWDKGELEAQIGRSILGERGGWHPEKRIHRWPYTLKNMRVIRHDGEPEKKVTIVLKSISIKVSMEDAIFLSQQPAEEVRSCSLKFNPIWVYKFSFNVQKNFKSKIAKLASSGEGFVDALTGENSFTSYHEFQERAEIPTQNYEVKEAKITREEAIQIALEAIIRQNTKEIRLNEMIGDTIVSERKVIAPEPGEINISPELVHLPVWEVTGLKLVEVNAHTGQVISSREYYDAEFL